MSPSPKSKSLSRRRVLKSATTAAAVAAVMPPFQHARATAAVRPNAEPFPLAQVRLGLSIYAASLEKNLAYLHKLEPDRLLHNYRVHAGLKPKAPIYGGWESESIAGHTLGHYLTACSLMHAQTGDVECKKRVAYIVDELAICQSMAKDGYLAAFLRRNAGKMENGKAAFEEARRGDIRATNFDLNGAWSPLYNWHKLIAGLIDADRHCGVKRAIPIAERLGGYIEGIFAALDDAQTQRLLACEYGGINEAFAELYARTGKKRWLALAERIYDRKVLDPLAERRDSLRHLHANTQVPKLVGLARLHELTGNPRHAVAASFFWETVTKHYTYVIGGNSDREYFQKPDSISKFITEQTCESCNTYNMLKLTRHLYAWKPDAAYFDYYERAHLNHIMAQQNYNTGMFAYMNPLMAGEHREFSSPDNDFWCCVGTGMESHAKYGDSIYWRAKDELIINLYIASVLLDTDKRERISIDTAHPIDDEIRITYGNSKTPAPPTLALRIPAWCGAPRFALNGEPIDVAVANGYARIRRTWKVGDKIVLTLPHTLRVEPTPDDPNTIALLHGPFVLAADLGPASEKWSGTDPFFVAEDVLAGIVAQPDVLFRTKGIARPTDVTLMPFAFLQERNTAVYFRRFTDAAWKAEQAAQRAEAERVAALDARSTDIMRLGDETDEKAHDLKSNISYAVVYRRRKGRDARSGGFFEFTAKTKPGPLILQATYWGGERNRRFRILIDGEAIASVRLDGEPDGEFIVRDYPIPEALTQRKETVRVRFDPETGFTAGPSFGVRIVPA